MSSLPKVSSFPVLRDDCSFGGASLYVDLIPKTAFGQNIRTLVPRNVWQTLRQATIRRANNRCECCGGAPARLDVHERWLFDDTTGQQILKRLLALCPPCHAATHMGLARIHKREERAKAHMARVNRWPQDLVDSHLALAFSRWEKRSKRSWVLNLDAIRDFLACQSDPADNGNAVASAPKKRCEAPGSGATEPQ